MKNKNSSKALSLAELAVVIAIIGLLASIVTGGVKLQKASEIRGFISDANGYQVSVESFNTKYEDLPGDMTDATDYWGTYNSSTNPNGTVNGNGNGKIERPTSGEIESLRAWQQLNLSGYIDGGYTGVATTGDDQADLGVNVPRSARDMVGYEMYYGNMGIGNRNEIRIGKFTSGTALGGSPLTVEEAYSIDKKLDDGNPTGGKVAAADGSSCRNAGNAALYNTGSATAMCQMSFPITP